jgi:hypothetical protein
MRNFDWFNFGTESRIFLFLYSLIVKAQWPSIHGE